MSYENTKCPCGGKKDRQTIICDECRAHLAGTEDLAEMDDSRLSPNYRRAAAIRVLAKARRRISKLPLRFHF